MATPADKRFYQLTLAIQKAINSVETPVKEKHVRSTIIGTFQEQSAITYWMVALRQPLQENRIVAWKFCHVTHKILREGHPACLDDSQRHIAMIENLGKLWVHLREGYGKLVHLYCGLLVCKLKFHARNPRFPGNMQLTADELDAVAENDVNNYFQLCVELFDYMDEILNLQAAVFDSLGNARANSMTASGQCRLAALIPCAQDASQMYDCNVRALFRLHASLPADTLAGHRDRFRQQFKKLGSFYKHASSLQYYRNLLTLPVLPANPPNFLLQSELRSYVTPVVSVPEPSADEPDAALVDTSDIITQSSTPDLLEAESPAPSDPLLERDSLIHHLQTELKRIRSEVSHMVQERSSMVESMREYSTRLETELQGAKKQLNEERQKAESISAVTPQLQQKLTETEEKAKTVDDKFQKLKGAYTQLREEHISLIRQKAEVDKLAATLRSAAAQHESAKTALQQQLNDKIKDVEILQQSASTSEEVEAYKSEISNLRTEIEQTRQKDIELESLRATMETMQIEHKTILTEQEEKVTTLTNDLKEAMENLERTIKERDEKDNELVRIREELVVLKTKTEEEYNRAVEEREVAVKQVAELTQQYCKEKQERDNHVTTLELDLENFKAKLNNINIQFSNESTKLKQEIVDKNKIFDEELILRETEIKDAITKIENLEIALETCKTDYNQKIIEKDEEISKLQSKIIDLSVSKDSTTTAAKELETINKEMKSKLIELQLQLDNKNTEINDLNVRAYDAAKDITTLEAEVDSRSQEITRLEEELIEAQAELEIGKNEFFRLREEHDNIVKRNDKNLTMKNEELRSLHDTINKLMLEKVTADNEKCNLLERIDILKSDYAKQIANKDEHMKNVIDEKEKLKVDFDELQSKRSIEIEKLNAEIEIKEQERQQLQTRLEHEESQRLNAECELQDLLQHNNILETDVVSLKRRLDETQKQLELQTSKLVSCTSEAALSITNAAISSLDRASALDSNKAAAELAARALEELASFDTVQGSEEAVSRAAVSAAHNTAQLAAYVTDAAHLATQLDQTDRLTTQSRSMLLATKRCLEPLVSGGAPGALCSEARQLVQDSIADLEKADAVNGTSARSVDDEMADMDKAIEQAATQIESLLAASKAGDTGIKLEVNGKILDACTTLMGAVRLLVRDARRLQRELGDTRARQRLYRRNPLWSEGLISAAKAVVLAAKMLVSSADAAVGGSGRVEGVSAAAHEVAAAAAALLAASRARAPPAAAASAAALSESARAVAAATAALLAAATAAADIAYNHEALDTSALTLTATRRLEMESKIRALELESALDAERAKLAALRKRHYHLAQLEENGNLTNGKE